MGDAQPDAGDRGLDRVHVLPVDVALGEDGEAAGEGPERPLDPEPADQAGGADVNGDEAERPLDLVEADVVDPDDLAAVDVDDLLVEQVGLQEDLVFALLELADVDRVVWRRAPVASSCATEAHGTKMRRLSVLTTSPVTGG